MNNSISNWGKLWRFTSGFFLLSLCAWLSALPLTSWGRPDSPTYRTYLQSDSPHDLSVVNIGAALNDAQDYMEEYGIITISTPILTSAQSGEFLFNLTNGAAYYFNDAKTNVQGKAAGFNQTFQTFQGNVQAQLDPTEIAAYAFQVKKFLSQESAYQLQQQAAQQAASLTLSSALAQATATNTSPAAQQAAEAAAWSVYAATGTNAPPTFPIASAYNSNSLANPDLALTSTLNSTNAAQQMVMESFQGLLNNIQAGLSLDDRSALLTAAGDQEIENFFRAISNPADFGDFLNPVIFFGVSTVSIDPGWRTRKGNWAGKVDATAKLEFKDARRETVIRILNDPVWPAAVRSRIARDYGYNCDSVAELEAMGITRAKEIANALPCQDFDQVPYSLTCKTMYKPIQVMVISPMVESETFDLASSYRAQSEFSMMLSVLLNYSGATVAGKAFEDFAKSQQHDIATVTSLDMVNSFGGQDGTFGFEIGPQPEGLADPASTSGKSGNVLERQTFPALLIMTMSKGDIEPRVIVTNNVYIGSHTFITNRVFRVYEPYISLSQTPNWVPVNEPSYLYYQHAEESQKLSWADELETAAPAITNLNWNSQTDSSGHSGMEDVLRARLSRYEEALLGTINYVTLPQDRMVPNVVTEEAFVTNVAPSNISLHFNPDGTLDTNGINFLLQGGNLNGVTSVTTLFPNGPDAIILSRSPSALVVQETIINPAYPVVFKLSSTNQTTDSAPTPTAYSPPVTLSSPLSLPQVLDVEPRQITLSSQTNGSILATNVTVYLMGSGLSRVDTNTATVASGNASLNPSTLTRLGDGLQATLTVTNAGQAISLQLSVPNWPRPGDANTILSKPIQVNLDTSAVTTGTKASANTNAASNTVSNVVSNVSTNVVFTITTNTSFTTSSSLNH